MIFISVLNAFEAGQIAKDDTECLHGHVASLSSVLSSSLFFSLVNSPLL
jgi:hypothetical protein